MRFVVAAVCNLWSWIIEMLIEDHRLRFVGTGGSSVEGVDGDVVDVVVATLEAGEAVVLPTDTVYGLVALPGDRAAVAQLFALKGRPEGVPLAVLCANADQALALAEPELGPEVRAVASRWWPGPLTLVVPRRPDLELHLGQRTTTIGVRVPADDLVRAVAARVGPVAATSANRHGEPTPSTADEVAWVLGNAVPLVIDGGHRAAVASTVIDTTTWPWTVLRAGAVDPAEVVAEAATARSSNG